jgi:hypothetical protein
LDTEAEERFFDILKEVIGKRFVEGSLADGLTLDGLNQLSGRVNQVSRVVLDVVRVVGSNLGDDPDKMEKILKRLAGGVVYFARLACMSEEASKTAAPNITGVDETAAGARHQK